MKDFTYLSYTLFNMHKKKILDFYCDQLEIISILDNCWKVKLDLNSRLRKSHVNDNKSTVMIFHLNKAVFCDTQASLPNKQWILYWFKTFQTFFWQSGRVYCYYLVPQNIFLKVSAFFGFTKHIHTVSFHYIYLLRNFHLEI